jgi:LCP family protein required for cell wall assembly
MSQYRRFQKKVNKRKRRRRLFIFLVLPILLVVGSATAYGFNLFAKAKTAMDESFEKIDRAHSPLREGAIDPDDDNISILFMGIDESEQRNYGNNTRTDGLILATFNKKQKSVKLVSIPRDSYVYIPEEGKENKINHAHASGGSKATMETVEELFDVPVDYYVKLNFKAFMEVVDSLDGVKVNVPYEMYEKNSKDEHNAIHLEKGVQTLNGEEALAFARTRKQDSDIYRGQRQQEVMKAIVNKASSVGSINKYEGVIKAIGDNMKTNLTFNDMLSFYDYATKGTKLDIETITLEGEDYQPGGTYYYKLNDDSVEKISKKLKKHLEIDSSSN